MCVLNLKRKKIDEIQCCGYLNMKMDCDIESKCNRNERKINFTNNEIMKKRKKYLKKKKKHLCRIQAVDIKPCVYLIIIWKYENHL